MGTGKPLIILHGGGTSALAYQKNIKLLAKKYRVIAPNLPFFDGSSPQKNPTEYIEILDNFIDFLGIKKAAIIGHSFGGAVALRLSIITNKDSFLILINSAGIALRKTKIKLFYKLLIEKTLRNIFMYRKLSIFLLIMKIFFKNLLKNLTKLIKIGKIMENFLYTDFRNFPQIKAKTLILWGKQDEIFPKETAKKLQSKIKNAEIQYVAGNHDWCLFYPEKFATITTDWLKKNNY